MNAAEGKSAAQPPVATVDEPPTTHPLELRDSEPTPGSVPFPSTEVLPRSVQAPARRRSRKRSVYMLGGWSLVAVGLMVSTFVAFRQTGSQDKPPPRLVDGMNPRAQYPPPGVSEAPASAAEFQPLFNGKDLAGWKTYPTQPG